MPKVIGYTNGTPILESEVRTAHDPHSGQFTSGGGSAGKGGKLSSGGIHYAHANNSSGAADKASAHAHEQKTSKAHHEAAAAHKTAAADSAKEGLTGQSARHLKKAEQHTKTAKKLGG